MPHLPPQPAQTVTRFPVGRRNLRGQRLELHPERGQALQKRVVNLPAQPGPLGEDHRVLLANGPDTHPPGGRHSDAMASSVSMKKLGVR
jgi:hypothetical protein